MVRMEVDPVQKLFRSMPKLVYVAVAVAICLLGASLASAAPPPVTPAPTGPPRVDLKVLLLGGTGTEPSYLAWKAELQREGVPFEAIAATPGHTPISAAQPVRHARGRRPGGQISGRDPRDRRPGRV